MTENQFVVDLGSIKLSDEQREKINAAINSAVAGEIANMKLAKRVVLLPVDRFPKGPILCGIWVRPVDETKFNELVNIH